MNTLVKEAKNMINEVFRNLKRYKLFIVVFFLYLVFFHIYDPDGSNCLVQRTFHLPCPMCGMTRASKALLQLDIEKAIQFHPLVFIIPIILGIVFLQGYGVFGKLYNSKVFWGVMIALFVVVYIIRLTLYFPHTEPMIPFY